MTAEQYVKAKQGQLRQLAWLMAAAKLGELPNRKGDKFGWDVIAQYDRPAIAHPHATIMAKYAEVAQRRIDPWVEFEIYSESFGNWIVLEVPTFFDSVLKYRHIGDAK